MGKKLSIGELAHIHICLEELYPAEELDDSRLAAINDVARLLSHIEALTQENTLIYADMASLIQSAIKLRENFSPVTINPVTSPLYGLDEIIHQTTAIGAVTLLREVEAAEELRREVERLQADLTFGVFPGWRSYEEWVASGRQTKFDEEVPNTNAGQ